MKYFIDYQYLRKNAARPSDDGQVVGIEVSDAGGFAVIPNVGDYVQVENSADPNGRSSFSGKVRSRLFTYIRGGGQITCGVNIVVEEDDDDWGKLIKE